jgi:hypothetical protein
MFGTTNQLSYQILGDGGSTSNTLKRAIGEQNPNTNYVPIITAISGGDISIRISNTSTNYPITQYYWYAL